MIVLLLIVTFDLSNNVNGKEKRLLPENIGPGIDAGSISQIRDEQYQLIKPIYLLDLKKESEKLLNLKSLLTQFIESNKQSGAITSASVYYREFYDSNWIGVNEQENYRPGSINKIPLLIYYLKMSESYPGLLEKKYKYEKPYEEFKVESYKEYTLELGKSYSVRDLLSKMIIQSDNAATDLLLLHLDKPEQYEKVFNDLHIPPPKPYSTDYAVNVVDCSKFLRVLFNSTYLSEKNSEFAMELLSKSDFKDGLKKELPENIIIAHKFGESGTELERQFSETGIIYNGVNTYLLTVMTKGTDSKQQADFIASLSKLVYNNVAKP